ncbi:MAG: hypothetical protein Q9164_003050 [Protoblastenia rupestris]
MSDSGSQPHPAYCEEYSEEAQTTVPETKQSANIAAKRSKADIANPKTYRDEFSDSGYSTNTHGTIDSSLDFKLEAAHFNAQQAAALGHEVPAILKKPSQSRYHSPRRDALRRIGSKGRKDGSGRKKDCVCDKCVAAARRTAASLEVHGPPDHLSAPQRKRTPAPPSPQLRKMQPPQDVPPMREHVRPQAATTSRSRPISFHAGTMPEAMSMAPPPSQPLYVERQLPSGPSAFYPFPPPSYPPPQHSYFQPAPPPPPPPPQDSYASMSLPYELYTQPQLRPHPHQWASEHHPQRPQSMYYGSLPILESAEPIYKFIEPRPPPIERQVSHRGRRTSLREAYAAPDEDYKRMPPPPPPQPVRAESKSRLGQRPTMRHAVTMSAAYPELRHRGSGYDSTDGQVSKHHSRKPSYDGEARSRRPSLARHSKTGDEKVVGFDAIERDMRRLDIEQPSNKMQKSSSVYGHESLEQLEGSVEAYQASKGNVRSPTFSPTHEEAMRLVRKKTNTSSDTGSRASAHSKGSRGSREGSDTKSRKALDRKSSNDVNARNENDRFALRFNPDGINVKMQGGIEGRAINLRKSKDGDGDMELSIESRTSIEARGRAIGSRPMIREKSRKRYSYIEGQGVTEIEGMQQEASRQARLKLGDHDEPRIIGERIITTTRSRRSSRYAYDGTRDMI